MTTQQLRNKLERLKGEKTKVEQDISALHHDIAEKKKYLIQHEEAREIIRIVGKKTQEQLSYHISDITSIALEAIFDDPYKLEVEFVLRRNKTECDIYFTRDGEKRDPKSEVGVGAVDVAAFALRIAAWTMQIPRTRNTIWIDEPFKYLKGREANLRVLDMVNKISERLNLQLVMVSDERIDREDIIAKADRVFETRLIKGITKIQKL